MRITGSEPSGRRRRCRPKCEEFLRLDVRTFDRYQIHRPDVWTCVLLSKTGYRTIARARIGDQVLEVIHAGGDLRQQPSKHRIRLDRTPCPYGGHRLWLRCPRCDSRRAVLFGFACDGRFGCWGCMDVVYASQDERKICRLWRRQAKLERKLIEGYGRHPGMHWRTFAGIHKRIDALHARQERLFCDGARTLVRRRGWL